MREYAEFINQVAKRIHELDPHHPVALSNGETFGLRSYAKYAPDVDIFGVNSYRRPGFGTLWQEVQSSYDKPVLLTEFGTLKPRLVDSRLDEVSQAEEHRAAWCDVERHTAGKQTPGNAIGGFAYEWLDEWWFDGQPSEHDAGSHGINNEWHGLASQGDGQDSPRQRTLRKAYFIYQKLWKSGELRCE